jgi:hypothetical protein
MLATQFSFDGKDKRMSNKPYDPRAPTSGSRSGITRLHQGGAQVSLWLAPANVTNAAFGGDQWCFGDQKTTADVRIGYRELDIGDNDDYTLTFVP